MKKMKTGGKMRENTLPHLFQVKLTFFKIQKGRVVEKLENCIYWKIAFTGKLNFFGCKISLFVGKIVNGKF